MQKCLFLCHTKSEECDAHVLSPRADTVDMTRENYCTDQFYISLDHSSKRSSHGLDLSESDDGGGL